MLGAQVAIPILDREVLVGVAVFDGRLTGEPFTNEELALIFHLLEELGLAIRNSWLHDQIVANHEMMADILNQSGTGCIVVSRELTILHANQAARDFFTRPDRGGAPIEFGDLPQAIGSRVFEALQSGLPSTTFKYRPHGYPEVVYRLSVVPFKRKNSITSNAVVLMIEDFTRSEKSQQLEIEASNLRLVKSMAEHLAHEIGNALVPISTHQRLLKDSIGDPEFQRQALKLIQEKVSQGRVPAAQEAYLFDRIAMYEGRPQRYGTQSLPGPNGRYHRWQTEDPEGLNDRRRLMGLPPVDDDPPQTEPTFQSLAEYEHRLRGYEDWLRKTGWR